MKEIFLLLGSNRGDRFNQISKVRELLAKEAGAIIKASSHYETEPWGFTDSTFFINQVVELDSDLEPERLLACINGIEKALGRKREEAGSPDETLERNGQSVTLSGSSDTSENEILKNIISESFSGGGCSCYRPQAGTGEYASRPIDIDILFFGSRLVFTDHLMIPHPRLHTRRFTLLPLMEIAPGFIHPLLKKSVSALLQVCDDTSKVNRI